MTTSRPDIQIMYYIVQSSMSQVDSRRLFGSTKLISDRGSTVTCGKQSETLVILSGYDKQFVTVVGKLAYEKQFVTVDISIGYNIDLITLE